MRAHASAVVSREALIAQYRAARARTRELFAIPVPQAYYDRPIAVRNPIVFYEGHLPAFCVNTLVKLARGGKGIDPVFESLFERGIDPEDETAVRDPAEAWPSRSEVQAYGRAADDMIEDALRNLEEDPLQIEAAHAIFEHELMHQETFVYMLHNLPFEKKIRRSAAAPPLPSKRAGETGAVAIPPGAVTLGANGSAFGWDNEFPMQKVHVDGFEIDRCNVTNGDYLEFMNATGSEAPHFWSRGDGQWFWRSMFELKPLPLDAPVWVMHEEAASYARWKGSRLMTEAEYHRAAYATPSGEERRFPWGSEVPDASRCNAGFDSWDPMPVGSHPAGASAWGVHDLIGDGWEWTATPFRGFPGFRPMASYPRYSADFFDDQHFVLKGASPVTGRELVRSSFRNWFRPGYPYLYAKFRCVR